MYVADIDNIEELQLLLEESREYLQKDPDCEQCKWDIEDILERIEQIKPEPPAKKKSCSCEAWNHAYRLDGETRVVHSESCDFYWD